PEMEQKFQKMQQQPPKVILSGTAVPAADDVDLDAMMKTRVSDGGSADDFQISTPVRKIDAPTIDDGGESASADAATEPAASAPGTTSSDATAAETAGESAPETAPAQPEA